MIIQDKLLYNLDDWEFKYVSPGETKMLNGIYYQKEILVYKHKTIQNKYLRVNKDDADDFEIKHFRYKINHKTYENVKNVILDNLTHVDFENLIQLLNSNSKLTEELAVRLYKKNFRPDIDEERALKYFRTMSIMALITIP